MAKGDPYHVSFTLGNCPSCGADLLTKSRRQGGHVRSPLGIGNILFSACLEHFDAASESLKKHQSSLGYMGEWEPRLGLIAEISHQGTDEETSVRIC